MHHRALHLVVIVLAVVLGCGRDRTPTQPSPTPVPPTPTQPPSPVATLDVLYTGDTFPLIIGATTAFGAFARLQNGQWVPCGAAATWVSSDPSILDIRADGSVTGIAPGTATITGTCWGVSASLAVRVHEGADVFGTVRGEDGAPIAGANVGIGSKSTGTKSARTDANGHYRISGVVRGVTYPMSASVPGYEVSAKTVTLSEPETRIDFVLRAGVRLYVTVLEAGLQKGIAGVAVDITDGENAGRVGVTREGGLCEFERLVPGRFTLRASKAGYDPLERTIDAFIDTSVELKLQPSYGSCLVSVSPTIIERLPSAGADAAVSVGANIGRAWTASADQPWVEFPSGAGGVGAGMLLMRVLPAVPGATAQRSAVVRVGCSATEGAHIKLSQLPDCRITLSWAPGSVTSFPASGGQGQVLLRTGVPRCHWEASSTVDWLNPVGVSSWFGDFDPSFTVKPNDSGRPRVGVIMFGETPWEVRQSER